MECQNVVVKNVSMFPILVKNNLGNVIYTFYPKEERHLCLKEGYTFECLQNSKGVERKVFLGKIELLRLSYDMSGMSYTGPLSISTIPAGKTGFLKIGTPLQYRDDMIFSQKTQLKSFTGGVPWVDIVNYTDTKLYFQDGLGEPSEIFSINPGDKKRYMGRYHYGVNYGTYIKNLDGIYETVQILSPITHLMYGVL